MAMLKLKRTQEDLFGSDELPEWLHVNWTCQNNNPETIIDDCMLPSVQCSIPPVLKLSTSSLNANLLCMDDGIKLVFRCARYLFQQVVCGTAEIAMVDLDRLLNYITAFAKNIELDGDQEILSKIAREFKQFIVQAGSLSRHIINDDLFSTRNIETNYTFHALLTLWLKAVRISSLLKRFSGFDRLYPMGDASSSTEQLSILVGYGLMLSASITGRPLICRCVSAAWSQLFVLNGQIFWSNMEKLLDLCTGEMRYNFPENLSSDMFLDLCDADGKISAEIFLELILELNNNYENLHMNSGKVFGSYMECLRRIAMKVVDRTYALRKFYFLFKKAHSDSLVGAESILQHFFACLCSYIMEPSNRGLDFYPANGKLWKDFVASCCNSDEDSEYSEWILFIRLMQMITKKSQSVYRAMKSRIFSKFPAKRYREMPVYSLICLFSLFIASLFGSDTEEIANKVISLATSAFDPFDKERHDILIRAIQSVKYVLEEGHYDSSQVTATLISLMERLDEKRDASLYTECCVCIGDKIAATGSLARFLPSISNVDLEQFFIMTAKYRSENNALWNAAINYLKTPNYSVAVHYIVEQLKIKMEWNASLASQNIRFVVQHLLAQKNYRPEVCSYFLKELHKNDDLSFPTELIVPVWLAIVLEEPELTDLSIFICKKLIKSFQKNNMCYETFTNDLQSTNSLIRWLFKTVSKNAVRNKKWIQENITEWLELFLWPLQYALMKVEEATAMHCCRITSFIYLYAAQEIYKSPSECNFNRSPFVRLCKLTLQNVFMVRNFPIAYVREVLPNYMVGMISLPLCSVPYLLRVISDILEKYSSDYILKENFAKMLKDKPQVVTALYASSRVGTNLFSFVSQIK